MKTKNTSSVILSDSEESRTNTSSFSSSRSLSSGNSSLLSRLGFTLVELIVVITILVILGTIAFTSLSGFSGSARDGSRVSDLANLSKSLDIASVKTGSYPLPDNAFSVTYSGGVLWNQWTVWDTVMNVLSTGGAKMNKKPTDPLTTTKEYIYSTLAYGNGYQLKTDYEGDSVVYNNPLNPPYQGEISALLPWQGEVRRGFEIIDQASAASWNPTLTYIKGNYNGMVAKTITGSITYLIATPSIITSQTGATGSGFELTTALANKLFTHGSTNSGGIAYTAKLVFSSGSLPSNDSERILFASGIANAYSGTVLASQSNIKSFIDAGNNTGTLASLGGSLVSTSLGGSANTTTNNNNNNTAPSLCGTSNSQTVSTNGFSGSLCAAGSSVITWSGNGGTTTASGLTWVCQNGSSTGSCSAVYNKPTTGTGGQPCDTYDKLIGSLTGSYAVWSMCNMGAYNAWASQGVLSDCAGSASDCASSSALRYTIGSYYQWGRNNDVTPQGTPTSILALAGTLAGGVGHSNFITNGASPYDWITTQNDNLWGGSGTTATAGTFASQGSPAAMQGPCPAGYHVPTQYEWWQSLSTINSALTNTSSWQNDTSVATTLKLPLSGLRSYSTAAYYYQGVNGFYWSASPSGIYGYNVVFSGTQVIPLSNSGRALGFGVRCLKN